MDGKIKNAENTKDYRLGFVAVLRKLFGYSIFLMLIYCFFAYKEDLNMVNFYRIMSYFDTDASVTENFTGYTFEVGIDSVYAPFNGGLAVLNKDSLKLINAAGIEDLSVQLKYNNPQLLTSDKRILAYDKGGKSISLFGSYALLKKLDTDNSVLWCKMNKNGDFLVLYDEVGYKGSMQLYSNDIKEKFQWSASEYYILSGCINEKGDIVSLLCLGGKDSTETIIRTYSILKENPLYDIDVAGSIVYSMEYDKNGNLVVISDSGVSSYDAEGKLISKYSYSSGALKCFYHKNSENPAIAITKSADTIEVMLLNGNEASCSFEVNSDINSIFYETNMLSALSNDKAYVYDIHNEELLKYDAFAGKSISRRTDGSYLIIFSDRAEILSK